MQNLWDDTKAKEFQSDLELRVYTSNLLGQSDELVLHGGGNTSVKSVVDGEDILFVKGSGWDLVSIKAEGFAPVKLEVLKAMAKLEELSDSDMVAQQKAAMIDSTAPNPSVEAILHAIIPYKFVDHTHADAVVTISNSVNGKEHIASLFPNFLIIDYVMPGFVLAQEIYKQTQDFDWSACEGIILHNHGIFTFDNDAKISYAKMIDAVTKAEDFLRANALYGIEKVRFEEFNLTQLRGLISHYKGYEVVTHHNASPLALYYASLPIEKLYRGVLTPEHIIRTKRHPLVLKRDEDMDAKILEYIGEYEAYFEAFKLEGMIMLNPTPNYAVIEGFGVVSFGKNTQEARIIDDIITHTIQAVLRADKLGGYQSISLMDSFDMEYWELEQAKLKK
ncbi:MAG: class II aldolase/adducin family protein [Campylobacterales bacterium]|nr:class II aldolase/adducin family protein [Campylobacterales bacterium]